MLSRSEAEFFGSEPAIYYYAETLKPDGIVYGFTLANIAMICAESLRIPIVGFILQPSIIPSSEYSPVTPLLDGNIIGKTAAQFHSSAGMQRRLRYVMEDMPLNPNSLSSLRKRRGLEPIPRGESWKLLVANNSPVVVPIHAAAFMGKPADWAEHTNLTEFIFLRHKVACACPFAASRAPCPFHVPGPVWELRGLHHCPSATPGGRLFIGPAPAPFTPLPPPHNARRQGCIRRGGTSEASRQAIGGGCQAVGGGHCRLQMPVKLALAVRETVPRPMLGALGCPPLLPSNMLPPAVLGRRHRPPRVGSSSSSDEPPRRRPPPRAGSSLSHSSRDSNPHHPRGYGGGGAGGGGVGQPQSQPRANSLSGSGLMSPGGRWLRAPPLAASSATTSLPPPPPSNDGHAPRRGRGAGTGAREPCGRFWLHFGRAC